MNGYNRSFPQSSQWGNSLGWAQAGFSSLSCLLFQADKLPRGRKFWTRFRLGKDGRLTPINRETSTSPVYLAIAIQH